MLKNETLIYLTRSNHGGAAVQFGNTRCDSVNQTLAEVFAFVGAHLLPVVLVKRSKRLLVNRNYQLARRKENPDKPWHSGAASLRL